MNGFSLVLIFFLSVILDLNSFPCLFFFYLEIQIVFNLNYCAWSSKERIKFSGFSFFNVELKTNTSSLNLQLGRYITRS